MRSVMPVLVEVGGGAVEVAVPSGWEQLPALPGVPYLAREPGVQGRFCSNVTVSAGPAGGTAQPDPSRAGRSLAGELQGVLVDALAFDGGAVLVVAHDAGAGEVVAVQRQLHVGDQLVAVTYTAAVERFADDHDELLRLARSARAHVAASDDDGDA